MSDADDKNAAANNAGPTHIPSPVPHSAVPTGGLSGHGTGGLKTTIAAVDLSRDPLISNAPRVNLEGKPTPCLGGIPLVARIGQGGMGAVYYGIHPRLNKEVAVKVLPFHLAEQQPELVQRFFREAQIASKVQSPHLVNVTDVNQESGLFYLVMEFVSGKSAGSYLRDLKQQGRHGMSEVAALDVCIAATSGLAAAHAEGVVHRDIKPDNILIPLVRKRGQNDTAELNFTSSKLADLGLARSDDFAQSMTGTGACMGTPGYMSPEQITDARSVGPSGDVFSMGATIYALLSGNAPFSGSALIHILMATQQQQQPPIHTIRPDVSHATAQLIDRCLAKNPAERYTDGSALLSALKMCRDALSTGLPHQSPLTAANVQTMAAPGHLQPSQTTLPPALGTGATYVPPQPPPNVVAQSRATGTPYQNYAQPYSQPPAPASNTGAIIGIVAVVLAVGAGIYFYKSRVPEQKPGPLTMGTKDEPEPGPDPKFTGILPPDKKTDLVIRPDIVVPPLDDHGKNGVKPPIDLEDAEDLGPRHVERAGGYSFQPPKGWDAYAVPGLAFKGFVRNAGKKFGTNVVVTNDTFAGEFSEYVTTTRKSLKDALKNYQELENEEFVTAAELAGHRVEASNEQFGNRLVQVYYMFPSQGKVTVLTYTCLEEESEEYLDLFDDSAASFKLLNQK